jgi:hypothetical protein
MYVMPAIARQIKKDSVPTSVREQISNAAKMIAPSE